MAARSEECQCIRGDLFPWYWLAGIRISRTGEASKKVPAASCSLLVLGILPDVVLLLFARVRSSYAVKLEVGHFFRLSTHAGTGRNELLEIGPWDVLAVSVEQGLEPRYVASKH